MERAEDVLKARICIREHRKQHDLGCNFWCNGGDYQHRSRTLSNIVLWFDFYSGMVNAVRPRFFMAFSIFDLGNLKNTCLEAEPEVIILAYPYH